MILFNYHAVRNRLTLRFGVIIPLCHLPSAGMALAPPAKDRVMNNPDVGPVENSIGIQAIVEVTPAVRKGRQLGTRLVPYLDSFPFFAVSSSVVPVAGRPRPQRSEQCDYCRFKQNRLTSTQLTNSMLRVESIGTVDHLAWGF